MIYTGPTLRQIIHEQDGVIVFRVSPHSEKTVITNRLEDGSFKIRIKEAAENNRANEALKKYLAELLHIKTDNIRILSGQTSTRKMLRITI